MRSSGFDWDAGNWPKCGKHGVSRQDIEALFDSVVTIVPAPERMRNEVRYIAVGANADQRNILVVFTFRQGGEGRAPLIRPISARYMREKERRYLEEEIARSQNR
ncbi:BrnT family toxin [Chelativorans alearense]|uniref:BrnT family toxin n=1 Tax=Chelativorans alearense TaxID=2681495 RepID=UPI0013D5F811|nr:BrnT family toxin [Chelativorans alearense]